MSTFGFRWVSGFPPPLPLFILNPEGRLVPCLWVPLVVNGLSVLSRFSRYSRWYGSIGPIGLTSMPLRMRVYGSFVDIFARV
jgi:hypothetical protein